MWYVIYASDRENSLEARKKARPAHIERVQRLIGQGRLLVAGPMPAIDSPDPGPAGFSGSTIIAEFESLEEAFNRLMGRLGDLGQRLLGRSTQLTAEAALVLTRSVPLDDAEARRMIGAAPVSDEKSFRDLLTWMYRAGVLRADQVGSLAGETGPGSAST